LEVNDKPEHANSRLFKARYFPNYDFLDSNIGHNKGFVWRSICSSKLNSFFSQVLDVALVPVTIPLSNATC